MKDLYGPAPFDYGEHLGDPGEFPYTRGIHPRMYRERLWTMRQYAGYGAAAESNARYRYLISQGVTGLSVAFDLPTQMGYDSDHSLAAGEVGRAGVAIASIDDLEELFSGIELDQVSTSMTINATAIILLALYAAAAKRRGVEFTALRGTVQNDILKEYIARGTYIYPARASMRLVTDVIAWTSREAPKFNPISISGYHMREAGATAVQEVAFTLANACAYIDAARATGLTVDEFAPRLSYFFSADRHFLEEAAKFRAARRLYARLMRERYGAKSPRSLQMRFHVQTGGSTLTAQQPEVNAVRTTIEALAAVLGGCQSLHTNALDEALALPTESSARLALRTQQVIAFESGVTETVDPLAGSYAVEALTDEIEEGARAYLERIDSLGGTIAAVEQGFVQREIETSAWEFQRKVESGERKVVGVNCFKTEDKQPIATFKVDREAESRRAEKLERLRRDRDPAAAVRALDALKRTAGGEENLFPAVLEAVEARATLGEISGGLREVFGTYRERTHL